MLRIPNPVTRPCAQCGQPTVLAEFPTGLHRVHCGTYRYDCGSTARRVPRSDRRHRSGPAAPDLVGRAA
jgi:ribosomal protein S27AE